MPLYRWKCKTCEGTVEVLRSFGDYEKGPEPDEVPEGFKCRDPEGGHDFERTISGKVNVVKGAGWGGGKGNW